MIIKPREEIAKSSETTKRDLKKSIDVTKLGVGITKMRKVTGRAVVVGCVDKNQAIKLKEKVTEDQGEKYTIQAPAKKKLKVKIYNIQGWVIFEMVPF